MILLITRVFSRCFRRTFWPRGLLAALMLTGCSKREYVVDLAYEDLTSGRQLPYWRPIQIDLLPPDSAGATFHLPDDGIDTGLIGQIHLGNTGTPINILLSKSSRASAFYDKLYVDLNRDRDFRNDSQTVQATPQFIQPRHRYFIEFERVPLPHELQVGDRFTEAPYLANLYYYASEGRPPLALRMIRECWRRGEFEFEKKRKISVILLDDDGNGIYDSGDSWAILPSDSVGEKYLAPAGKFQSATRLGWLETTVFELATISPDGARVVLRPQQLEIGPKEEPVANAPYGEEAVRPVAQAEISWLDKVEVARRQARRQQKNLLLYFYVGWSGPSQNMSDRTFKDAEIVSLSQSFICVRLDADRQPALAGRYNVTSLPTLLVLDSRGKELARVIGYQAASDLAPYLRQYAEAASK